MTRLVLQLCFFNVGTYKPDYYIKQGIWRMDGFPRGCDDYHRNTRPADSSLWNPEHDRQQLSSGTSVRHYKIAAYIFRFSEPEAVEPATAKGGACALDGLMWKWYNTKPDGGINAYIFEFPFAVGNIASSFSQRSVKGGANLNKIQKSVHFVAKICVFHLTAYNNPTKDMIFDL